MKRLVEEYFKRDLSESEEQQLAEQLAASPEDAQLMADRMGEIYSLTGLPEPVWKDRPLPSSLVPGRRGSLKRFMPWVLVSSLLLVASMSYLCYQKWFSLKASTTLPSITSDETSDQSQSSKPALDKMTGSVKKALSSAKARVPVSVRILSPSGLPKVVASPKLPTAKLPNPVSSNTNSIPALGTGSTAPSVNTVPLGSNIPLAPPGKQYQELSVVVDFPQSSLATVRVYDEQGNEVKTLFAGILPQGKKTFTWDGKNSVGLVTPPGDYYIEVKSGEKVTRQEVHVEADQIP